MTAAKIVSTSVVSNAEKALKEAVIRVIRDHKKTGDPVIVWRGGRVVKANPKNYSPVKI